MPQGHGPSAVLPQQEVTGQLEEEEGGEGLTQGLAVGAHPTHAMSHCRTSSAARPGSPGGPGQAQELLEQPPSLL